MTSKDMKMNFRRVTLTAALWIGAAVGVQAQVPAPSGAAPGAQADPANAYDSLLSLFEAQFMGAAKAMPADRYDFSPRDLAIAGATYDGVRTFGEEVKHVAQVNYFVFAVVSGLKPDTGLINAIGDLKRKDDILAAVTKSFTFGHQAMATLTTSNAAEVVKGPLLPTLQTKATLASFGVAHGFDHYGQMVEYLRMNGIVPPPT